MINGKILVAGILILSAGAGFAFAAGRAAGKTEGNGVVTTLEHIVPAFERFHIASNADVRIHRAGESRIVVSADSNLREFIEIRHESGHNAVEIRTRGREENFPRFTVDVYSPALTGIGATGAASVECVDPISVESFSADMTGSGTIILRGNAERVEINMVGDGAVDGRDFKTVNGSANIVGDGKMTVWTDAMTVNVVGNATIQYRGNPVLDIAGVGNGRFVRIGD